MINQLGKKRETPNFAIFLIKWLERIILCAAILISIYTWLKSVDFTPDSTNYIVAGKNLLYFHEFFVYSNWPSYSLDLIREPYRDFPPGFAILFAGFLFLLQKNLYLAITVSQTIYVILFYLSFAYFFTVLNIQKSLRILFWIIIPLFPPFIGIFQFYLSEALFIAISLTIGALCLSPSFEWRLSSWRFWLVLALICISSSVRFTGVLNSLWLLVPLVLTNIPTKAKVPFSLLVIIAGIAAPSLWFARNQLYYGVTTKSHAIGSIFLPDHLLTPFQYLFYTPLGVFGSFLAASLLIGLILCIKKLPRYIASGKRGLESNAAVIRLKTLVLVLLINFLFLVTVSLFAHINQLDGRLLSPTFAIALILIAFTLSHFLVVNRTYFWITAPLFIALILINLNTQLAPQLLKRRTFLPSITEKSLEQIFLNPAFAKSSGFYTEYNFNYQLYSTLPHRMLWDIDPITTPENIQSLFNKGNQVFFIFKEGSQYESTFKKHSDALPNVCETHFSGYVLFFQRDNCILH